MSQLLFLFTGQIVKVISCATPNARAWKVFSVLKCELEIQESDLEADELKRAYQSLVREINRRTMKLEWWHDEKNNISQIECFICSMVVCICHFSQFI